MAKHRRQAQRHEAHVVRLGVALMGGLAALLGLTLAYPVPSEPAPDAVAVPLVAAPGPSATMPPVAVAPVAVAYTLTADNSLTPELASWLLRLRDVGVAVDLTNDTAVLDTARTLCAETWTTPAAVGEAWGLSASQSVVAAELVAGACPAVGSPG